MDSTWPNTACRSMRPHRRLYRPASRSSRAGSPVYRPGRIGSHVLVVRSGPAPTDDSVVRKIRVLHAFRIFFGPVSGPGAFHKVRGVWIIRGHDRPLPPLIGRSGPVPFPRTWIKILVERREAIRRISTSDSGSSRRPRRVSGRSPAPALAAPLQDPNASEQGFGEVERSRPDSGSLPAASVHPNPPNTPSPRSCASSIALRSRPPP